MCGENVSGRKEKQKRALKKDFFSLKVYKGKWAKARRQHETVKFIVWLPAQ